MTSDATSTAPAPSVVATTSAMASTVRITVSGADGPETRLALGRALAIFHEVERECSRFDPGSDLSRVNASPAAFHRVGGHCFEALREAAAAHDQTGGVFDPRVLTDLVALGYDRWPPDPAAALSGRAPLAPWEPAFDPETSSVAIGPLPVDLGGIGKGLAVRWASAQLAGRDHLVEAGGDLHCAGRSPDGGPWRIAVEDPTGAPGPIAVLSLVDLACATSSVRLRRWTAAGREVHHLIDPRTGGPGGSGLLAVSVVAHDAAEAEVWSKALFLGGARAVATDATRRGIAAAWVDVDGSFHANGHLSPLIEWRRRAP